MIWFIYSCSFFFRLGMMILDGWMGKRARKYGNGTQENFEIGLLFFMVCTRNFCEDGETAVMGKRERAGMFV